LLVGSNELFIKNLKGVNVSIEWQTLPLTGNFGTYYAAYNTTPPVTNSSFQLSSSFLNSNKWLVPSDFNPVFNLFTEIKNSSNSEQTPSTTLSSNSTFVLFPLNSSMSQAAIDPSALLAPLKYDQRSANGFIKLELSSPSFGFGASLYSKVLTNTVLENAMIQVEQIAPNAKQILDEISNVYAKPLPLPNTPFTPVSKGIEVAYTSLDEIDLSPGAKTTDDFIPFYHIDTFNTYPVVVKERQLVTKQIAKDGTISQNIQSSIYNFLLPQYTIQGNLYIGLKELIAPQPLSILFQLSEKVLESSVSDLPPIKWSYLANDEWIDFISGVDLHDDTDGLIKPGIVTFNIPENISSTNTILPQGLFWIRVQASERLNIFGNLTAIYTQVIEVEYDGANPALRNSVVLQEASISKAIDSIPNLKSITQPFASTGGVVSENKTAFYTRVSERLRHKNRAIFAWDYERIVLQNFPQIYKVKCITNTNQGATVSTPSVIELVVIPKIVSGETFSINNTLPGPTFGFTMLEEIKEYIQKYTSVHANVTIRNPIYERLMVKCSVKFQENQPFSLKNLNDAICNFLSPWISGNQIAYDIGHGLQKSTILAFIQKLPYVEFVTGFSVIKITEIDGNYHFHDSATEKNTTQNQQTTSEDKNSIKNQDILLALTPYSVFASASSHLLTELEEVTFMDPTPLGIGEISIGMDFIIQKTKDADSPNDNNGTQTNFYLI
ncbi:MAG: baseplate J/gp47 family protein, partial [Sphingobacteriaceae bacterium]